MRRTHRGAALLIAVIFILSVAVLAAVVGAISAGGDITDSSYQASSVQALYAAEVGAERALKQFATGAAACGALNATNIAVSSGLTFSTSAGVSTDFSGIAGTLPASQCRVQITGEVSANNASRRLQAILDRNLLSGTNSTFNDEWAAAGPVSKWTATKWDYNGGPDSGGSAAAGTCRRAAYALHGRKTGGSDASATAFATIAPAFTIPRGQAVSVRFNIRVIRIGDSGSNANDTTATMPANPLDQGSVCGNPQANTKVWFWLTDTGGLQHVSGCLREARVDPGAPLNARVASATPTTQGFPGDYPSCASFYAAGTPTSKRQLTINVGGPAGSTRTINRVDFFVYLQRNQGEASETWLDNIELIADQAVGTVRHAELRDCAVSTCP